MPFDDDQSKLRARSAHEPTQFKFLTISNVADQLGVAPRTVRRAIDRRELVAHRFGKAVRIAENDLRDFIAQRRCW